MIPAQAIAQPGSRTLHMLSSVHGLFEHLRNPYMRGRTPFRINASTLIAPGVDEALAVLASLGPAATNWLATLAVDYGDNRGVWRVSGRYIEATPSRRLDADPLVDRTTPVWYATFGLSRIANGMHLITPGRRTLLHRGY